ncbi:hypothetical protein HYV84_03255 [Candidatus Woesearchaeota archaeon]|nr:hypothetical protein [Candidatus Woesearchaeota archaeon]
METIAKTRTLGGSLIVTIPKNVVEVEGLHADEVVAIDIKKVKKSYKGIMPGLGHLEPGDKLDTHD